MIDFLIQNVGTILVSLGLCTVVSLIIVKMVRDKKNGKRSCGCGCSGCASRTICHPNNNGNK